MSDAPIADARDAPGVDAATADIDRFAGLDPRPSRSDPSRLASLVLPLSEGQWAEVVRTRRGWLQEALIDALRDGGRVRADDLLDLDEGLRAAGGHADICAQLDGAGGEVVARRLAFLAADPLVRVLATARLVAGHLAPTPSRLRSADPDRAGEPWWTLLVAARDVVALTLRPDAHRDRARAARHLRLALPTIATLARRCLELDPGGVDGWAVCDGRPDRDGPVYQTESGWAIFETRELAASARDRWAADHPEAMAGSTLRPVRVSVQHGLQFLDEGPLAPVDTLASVAHELRVALGVAEYFTPEARASLMARADAILESLPRPETPHAPRQDSPSDRPGPARDHPGDLPELRSADAGTAESGADDGRG
jgi:hypothetical protein